MSKASTPRATAESAAIMTHGSGRSLRAIAVATVLVAGVCLRPLQAAEPTGQPARPFVPTANYEERTVAGWTVMVNRELLKGEREAAGAEALQLLDHKLHDVIRALPAEATGKLREVRIWLGVDDGHAPCAEYHPSEAWLRGNGYNPEKARCVEIGNAARFVSWSRGQPAMVLHELAHAYMDRFMPPEAVEQVRDAYREAKEKALYAQALHGNGEKREAYAMTDEKEYFAELTEAFYGTNDIYPFVRPELVAHDPKGAAAVRKAWEPDRVEGR